MELAAGEGGKGVKEDGKDRSREFHSTRVFCCLSCCCLIVSRFGDKGLYSCEVPPVYMWVLLLLSPLPYVSFPEALYQQRPSLNSTTNTRWLRN